MQNKASNLRDKFIAETNAFLSARLVVPDSANGVARLSTTALTKRPRQLESTAYPSSAV